MRAEVTKLRYWKSEHSENLCEDAYGEDAARGLFAVADGAGTTLFSALWAALLVKHCLRVPLMSGDPFEVEWWVRQAQEQFKLEQPDLEHMPWNVLQKAQAQGSHSTFASLRISSCDETQAVAELLAFGDSCIFVSHLAAEQPLSFPLEHEAEFLQSPVCLPSKAGLFNRYFHCCHARAVNLVPGDVMVLATDAVARWIVSAGNGHYKSVEDALHVVSEQTADTWEAFVERARASQEMVDDDSTALVITLLSDTTSSGVPLGQTTQHDTEVRVKRKQDFEQALNEQHKERQAIFYGDGSGLDVEDMRIAPAQIQQARAVADALQEVLAVLRQKLHSPEVATIMETVWRKHASLLYNEPCAENLRQTLTRLGVPLAVPLSAVSTDEANQMLDTTTMSLPPAFFEQIARQQETTEREET